MKSELLALGHDCVDLDSVVTVEEAKKIEDPYVRRRKTFEEDRNEASESLAQTLRAVMSNYNIYSDRYSNSKDYFKKIYNEELSRLKTEKVSKVRH